MVQFGGLCVWEVPEAAGTRMRDVVEIRTRELWESKSLEDSKEAGVCVEGGMGISTQGWGLGTWRDSSSSLRQESFDFRYLNFSESRVPYLLNRIHILHEDKQFCMIRNNPYISVSEVWTEDLVKEQHSNFGECVCVYVWMYTYTHTHMHMFKYVCLGI